MIIKVMNESAFQVLSSSFSIGPSPTGYILQVGADSKSFTSLFSVGPNTPRMVTNVANGSYYRLKDNVGEVKVNWQRVCTEEGGGASGRELLPVTEFPLVAEDGTVVSLVSGDTKALYQYDEASNEWSEVSPDLSPYWTSAETQSAITAVEDHLFDVEQVTASALTELHDDVLELSARTVDLSAYYTSAQTEDAILAKHYITSAQAEDQIIAKNYVVSGEVENQIVAKNYVTSAQVEDQIVAKNYVTSAETQDAIDEAISGITPSANSPIIPAIATQAEYETISGDVKTGDLIQVNGVDINGDNEPEGGLFEAFVEEEEEGGVVRKRINWTKKDNGNSVLYSIEDYPWLVDNDVYPIDLGGDTFFISEDSTAEDEAYNGIGFDGDGKPVITHFAPQYDEGTGEITGITRENVNMVTSTYVSTIWKGTAAEYEAIPVKDPNTFYIIVSN